VKLTTQCAAVAVASGVAVASLAGPASAQTAQAAHPGRTAAVTTTTPAAAAASYLARHLVGPNHDHYTGSYLSGTKTVTYVNYGETADGVLSMDAAGVAQTAAARATKYLEKNVTAYTGTSRKTFSPGAIGKLLLVAEAQHANPRSFGGLSLIHALNLTEGIRGAKPGEYQQNPSGTPTAYIYYSTVSQALAVLALANQPKAGAGPDAAAVKFLVHQQCADGGYPSQLLTSPTRACAVGEDIDSTGYAVQALLATGGRRGAADKGLAYLKKVERSNGGFGDTGAPNANSTALAIQAFIAGKVSVTKPLKWLARQQVTCPGTAADLGAVKYQGTLDASALLATSQAGAALAVTPLVAIDNKGAKAKTPKITCAK
jgi:hypothetical protein